MQGWMGGYVTCEHVQRDELMACPCPIHRAARISPRHGRLKAAAAEAPVCDARDVDGRHGEGLHCRWPPAWLPSARLQRPAAARGGRRQPWPVGQCCVGPTRAGFPANACHPLVAKEGQSAEGGWVLVVVLNLAKNQIEKEGLCVDFSKCISRSKLILWT